MDLSEFSSLNVEFLFQGKAVGQMLLDFVLEDMPELKDI